ncbi:hypothetical protein CYMTET_23141 [Cymbomonas tetramitiformis]|uniref:Uncharacterized protein n=1 Tax=Cymbomonas tetramitiformis TaxID=36881 RepID=A0AAE0FYV5_9CHLO|nr:hypothetical protein CYMTET_23141 [Cymbomonas tetramitiformis]
MMYAEFFRQRELTHVDILEDYRPWVFTVGRQLQQEMKGCEVVYDVEVLTRHSDNATTIVIMGNEVAAYCQETTSPYGLRRIAMRTSYSCK